MKPSKTALLCLVFVFFAAHANAVPVTDWHTFKAAPATTLSGQGTDDPVLGSIATTSSAGFILGYFSPLSLVNIGDQVKLTFSVSFNDATGMASSADNFRFGLYDLNGETPVATENTAAAGTTDTDNLRGYWFGVKASATGAQGSIRERAGTTPDLNPFANASAALLGTAGGTVVPLVSSVNGNGTGPFYSGTMTLELQSGGLALSGSFSGNGEANSFSFFDSTPVASTFGVVGFLNGGGLSADQIIFQDVSVVLVPEPTCVALLGIGSILLLGRRRRPGG